MKTRKMTAAETNQQIRGLRLPKDCVANIDPVLALNKHLLVNGISASTEAGRTAEIRELALSFGVTGIRSVPAQKAPIAPPQAAVAGTPAQIVEAADMAFQCKPDDEVISLLADLGVIGRDDG